MPPGCGDGGGEGSSVIETRRHQVIGAAGDGDGAREEAVKGRGFSFYFGLRSISISIIAIVFLELRSGPGNDPLQLLHSSGNQWRGFLILIPVLQIGQFSQERIERVNYRTIDKQSLFVFHDVCFSCD